MPGRVAGKVAFITGVARGQGRSHAIRLAQEGADIIGIDSVTSIDTVPYPMATPDDLAQTVKEVEVLGRRIIATEADVRDFGALEQALAAGVSELGRLDIVSANAGIASYSPLVDLAEDAWQDVIDINLTGVWHTAKAAIPHIRAGGRGGSIILTSSSGGLKGLANVGHYIAAKHGVVGLMRTLALELAPEMIRVNSVHPTSVNTHMILNPRNYALFAPELAEEDRTPDVLVERFKTVNALPIPWVEAIDISNAVLWLASDEARYVTGVTLPIDGGALAK
jgi:(+)-trans-carveol dehydrogenase